MVTPPYRQFPECQEGHWDSVKMLAVLQGLEEFDSGHKVTSQKVIEVPVSKKRPVTVTVPKLVHLPNGETEIVREEKEIQLEGEPSQHLKIIAFERESNMTLLSFLRYKMELAIKAEKRSLIATRRTVSLDDTYRDDDEHTRGDELCFSEMRDRSKLYDRDPLKVEEAYQVLIQAVESRLRAEGETRILRAFRLKLKHPAITNRQISKVLGVSKTYASSYFRKLSTIMDEVIETTDTLIR
jgi:hypothetical protein